MYHLCLTYHHYNSNSTNENLQPTAPDTVIDMQKNKQREKTRILHKTTGDSATTTQDSKPTTESQSS